MLRRVLLVCLVIATGLAPLGACGSDHRAGEAGPPAADGAPDEADVATSSTHDAATSFPVLPYPPGPHGTGIGEVMPDLTIQGYRLSRAERDSRKLPFTNIRLSEVRSDPECRCMLVIYNVAGTGCGPCVDMDSTVASLVMRDRSICAAEIIAHSFDALDPDASTRHPPPTRTDLDAVVQSSRAPFPVGLTTTSVTRAGLDVIPLIPDVFVVRPSDMKILAFTQGTGGIEARIRTACDSPWPPVETIATGLGAPRRMVTDGTHAYLSDSGAVVRVPLAGGAPEVVAQPSSPPDAVAVDATHVYWATHEGSTPFQIGRVARGGGSIEVLTSGSSGYTSIGIDDANVWFTRTDGVIASIPRAGGAETAFATEPGASSLVVDATTLFWIAGEEVVARPKEGGARVVLAKATDLRSMATTRAEPAELALAPDHVLVRARAPRGLAVLARLPKTGGDVEVVDGPPQSAVGVSPSGEAYYAIVDPFTGASAIAHFSLTGLSNRIVLTLRQHTGAAVAHDDTYAYWTDATDAGAVLKRIGDP